MKKVEITEMHLDEIDKHIILVLTSEELDSEGKIINKNYISKTLYKADGLQPVRDFFNENNLDDNMITAFIDSIWNKGFMDQAESAYVIN